LTISEEEADRVCHAMGESLDALERSLPKKKHAELERRAL
jgi:hypothetical protein